jgi:hypothetical protein
MTFLNYVLKIFYLLIVGFVTTLNVYLQNICHFYEDEDIYYFVTKTYCMDAQLKSNWYVLPFKCKKHC